MSDQFYFVGDEVEKIGGDYTFQGRVVAAFPKRSGELRYVVEDNRGLLLIHSAKNLRKVAGTYDLWPGERE